MCPRCGNEIAVRYMKMVGILDGEVFKPDDRFEAELTAIRCSNCYYPLYDQEFGWSKDVFERMDQLIRLAQSRGMRADQNFLTAMGIPLTFQEGGVYYVSRVRSDDADAKDDV